MKFLSERCFYQITKKLGLNPDTTPISCPINDPCKGLIAGQNSWGGAMGPAQFMPTTWLSYRNQVSKITGNNPANHGILEMLLWLALCIYLTGEQQVKIIMMNGKQQ